MMVVGKQQSVSQTYKNNTDEPTRCNNDLLIY